MGCCVRAGLSASISTDCEEEGEMKKGLVSLCVFSALCSSVFASTEKTYSENNHGYASFDISMPIDATGYTLQGTHLKGGSLHFADQGKSVGDFLAYETGYFQLPTSISHSGKPFIKTNVRYDAVKFIVPSGTHNLFIKIGTASRTETVSDLDPFVLKNGTYTWRVPFFAVGFENNTVKDQRENKQLIEIGTGDGPSHHNGMYTQQFYLYTLGEGDAPITAHPQKAANLDAVLKKPYQTQFTCHAEGIWGGGGKHPSDPYRTMTGQCHGESTTFPAGPNIDYEYGTFTLPTVHSPWTASPEDHCVVNGKKHAGCTNITIASHFHYMAKKIRVPLQNGVTLYAEFGTAYRSIVPSNLRYQCKENVYLQKILPSKDCLKKSYLPGGADYPYFAVGYEFRGKNGARYVARYLYLPEQENANRLAWRDASGTKILAIGGSGPMNANDRHAFKVALEKISATPAVRDLLGARFFDEIVRENCG